MLLGLIDPEAGKPVGKTLFAQVMELVSWKTFGRMIERCKGDADIHPLNCAGLFQILAFP
ncbi:MAG: DUF4372 domain-containing protein [Terracidiphilus sp.]